MLDTQHCANCARAIDGAEQEFCPACGQPTPARRIDWHYLGHELEHGVLQMDRGMLFTARHLFLRPGHFIRGYLYGDRAGHVKPLPKLVMAAAFLLLLGEYLLGGDVVGSSFTEGVSAGMSGTRDVAGDARAKHLVDGFEKVKEWGNRHLTLVTLLLLPAEALAFKLAFRRFREINYPEWLVITTYLTVQTFVIWALAVPVQQYWASAQPVALLLAVAFNVFTLMQYFTGYPKWKAILRAVFGLGLFQLFSNVVIIVGVVVLALRTTQGP